MEHSNGVSEKGLARRMCEIQKGTSLQHCVKGGNQRLTVLGISPSACLRDEARLQASSSLTEGMSFCQGGWAGFS